jgi:hypothetical protein
LVGRAEPAELRASDVDATKLPGPNIYTFQSFLFAYMLRQRFAFSMSSFPVSVRW